MTRLSEEDVARFRRIAIPLWFEWANKDRDAARVFKLQLEVMQNPSVAYLTPDDICSTAMAARNSLGRSTLSKDCTLPVMCTTI